MFTKSMYGTNDLHSQHLILNRVSELLDQGTLHTTLTKTLGVLTATNLTVAHGKVESGSMIGKLALRGIP
ncbi:Bifunctional protein: zinc-containing alcohol dehydrogenase; quinone oxidoreductase (NADPH:quinone reductase); Similar to arginate lyase [hydrothermal vent metagenome]|uniref:Bifunctional protein: zinc-containing alcohol dehydrogenase quinone oxidoreductase ( NADPH:quinone reductase) Similar to arginate lyase n=1 Tax=hydrothermal vent metagenome TaxID=652676 RepID=A0A3B0ZAQ7_9ZZZZ